MIIAWYNVNGATCYLWLIKIKTQLVHKAVTMLWVHSFLINSMKLCNTKLIKTVHNKHVILYMYVYVWKGIIGHMCLH